MSTATSAFLAGGEFLLRDLQPEEVFTPEDFTSEHRAIAKTVEDFWASEVAPQLEALQHQEAGVGVALLRKSAELGLTSAAIPEDYGGMGLDLTSMMVIAEGVAKDGSYAAWHGAHTGIGTLPLLFFGTEDQKRRYLPKLASCEMIAAYCLSEAHAGSDAMAARTTAQLSGDGTHYVLNGQKMWITNGGAADLFTVFAKVDDKLTAFLVERSYEGVKAGPEEKKMGIKGSSTCPIYLDRVKVPVENVLGEVGRGHIIAFNILNLGRLKLGPFAIGGAKNVLAASIRYAKDRIAFGKPIAQFGLIQQKLARMGALLFAAESMAYAVDGLVNQMSGGLDWTLTDAATRVLKAAEEYAVECSFVKVFGSEMLDFVVDEGVQIHGGYGYHQDYLVERAYRDSRINRIFEGTNEINRLLATGMLLKRAQRKQLPLVAAVMKLQSELLDAPQSSSNSSTEKRLVQHSKKVVLLLLGTAYQRFGSEIEQQQEVMAAIADAMMMIFGLECAVLRTEKLKRLGTGKLAAEYTKIFLEKSLAVVESSASAVIAACSDGDERRTQLAIVRKLLRRDAIDTISTGREIASALLASGRYVV